MKFKKVSPHILIYSTSKRNVYPRILVGDKVDVSGGSMAKLKRICASHGFTEYKL